MRLGEVRDVAEETERSGKGSFVRWRRFADPNQGSSDVTEKMRKESTACKCSERRQEKYWAWGVKIKRSKAMQGTLNLVLVDRQGCTIHLSHPFSTLLMRSRSAISPSRKIIFRHIKYIRREVQNEN